MPQAASSSQPATPSAPGGLLVFVSGPSGVGKSTICRQLARDLPAEFAVSATTRAGKPQDALGKRYLFITEPEFKQRLENNEFLEYANVFGHWYGTLKQPVVESLAAGKMVLLEIDVQGGSQIHQMFPDAVGIFIMPPAEKDLIARLQSRGRDDAASIQRRVAEAAAEVKAACESGAYRFMVVNQVLVEAIEDIKRFVAAVRQPLNQLRQL
ncbi:MAG: guanylate kinase [Phycisphaerales bacterium]|nr:guanylate kinase [Phycisphaerales bacterium]